MTGSRCIRLPARVARKAHGNFTGEIESSFKDRAEGVRVKHWLRGNSVKMYDKAGSVLRVETTIARTGDFKVLRPRHDDDGGKLGWRPLRKGVADLHRRAEVSQRSNDAYLDALATVDEVRGCYEQGLAFDPNLQGRIAVQFTIGPTGRVPVAVVDESSLEDARVADCVADAVKCWTFPKPQGGGNAVVTYRFVIEPG